MTVSHIVVSLVQYVCVLMYKLILKSALIVIDCCIRVYEVRLGHLCDCWLDRDRRDECQGWKAPHGTHFERDLFWRWASNKLLVVLLHIMLYQQFMTVGLRLKVGSLYSVTKCKDNKILSQNFIAQGGVLRSQCHRQQLTDCLDCCQLMASVVLMEIINYHEVTTDSKDAGTAKRIQATCS